MASLSAHLRRPDDHGRLAFHPECPVCCGQRLVGTLPNDAVVGRRTQALIAAGVLAFSSAPATAALAGEPDQEEQGAAAPEPAADDEAPAAPSYDPGGPPTDLPFDSAPAPQAQVPPDATSGTAPQAQSSPDGTEPLEQEPMTDEGAPLVDPGDGTGTQTGAQPQAPAPLYQAPASDPGMAPRGAAAPADQTPAPLPVTAAPKPEATLEHADADTASPPHERGDDSSRDRHSQDNVNGAAATPSYPTASPPSAPSRTTPQPEPVNTNAATTVRLVRTAPASASHAHATRRGDRFHLVQRDESLWSIADDLLGGGASPARVAREVNRLWELNSSRIGTGDRDLLMAGTRLDLR